MDFSLPAKYNHLSPACHLCAKAKAKTRTNLLKTSKITPKKMNEGKTLMLTF